MFSCLVNYRLSKHLRYNKMLHRICMKLNMDFPTINVIEEAQIIMEIKCMHKIALGRREI